MDLTLPTENSTASCSAKSGAPCFACELQGDGSPKERTRNGRLWNAFDGEPQVERRAY
jgi:hypothetical protein